MPNNPLSSLLDYSEYLARLVQRPSIDHSTVSVRPNSRQTGIAEGEVWFKNDLRLRMRELIDFRSATISSYGYEVYSREEKLYWYDSLPHPSLASLQETFPHHKHVQPNIGKNRVPAFGLRFDVPNLDFVVAEIEKWPRQ